MRWIDLLKLPQKQILHKGRCSWAKRLVKNGDFTETPGSMPLQLPLRKTCCFSSLKPFLNLALPAMPSHLLLRLIRQLILSLCRLQPPALILSQPSDPPLIGPKTSPIFRCSTLILPPGPPLSNVITSSSKSDSDRKVKCNVGKLNEPLFTAGGNEPLLGPTTRYGERHTPFYNHSYFP